MKRRFAHAETPIVLFIIVLLCAILFPIMNRARNGVRRSNCQSNLKTIGLSLFQYAQDYEGQLPRTQLSASTGWADVIRPWVKETKKLQCPSATQSETDTSDYFLNARLGRATTSKIKWPERTLLAGDGLDNAPTWSATSQLFPDALRDDNSPAQRHIKGANYLFADGHTKWFRPELLAENVKWNPQ